MPETNYFEVFIRQAIRLAEEAAAAGDHPFGALLVLDGEILLTARNTVITGKDATQHAEQNLVSKACQEFGRRVLSRSTLYASLEPCPMCAGAIYWAGIPRVVYGAPGHLLARPEIASPFHIPIREIYAHAHGFVPEVIGPVLGEEASRIHLAFWPAFLAKYGQHDI
ncbi:MAG: nucleoside deaminase [Anaerolineales bacterium]|nr:nucleoside deaminase [Anaerolineales bacterium]